MPKGPAIKIVDANTKAELEQEVNELYPDYYLDDIVKARDVSDWGYIIGIMKRKDVS